MPAARDSPVAGHTAYRGLAKPRLAGQTAYCSHIWATDGTVVTPDLSRRPGEADVSPAELPLGVVAHPNGAPPPGMPSRRHVRSALLASARSSSSERAGAASILGRDHGTTEGGGAGRLPASL